MTNKKKIRIFDDEEKLGQNMKAKVDGVGLASDKFDIDTIREFKEALEGIKTRQANFRKEGRWKDDETNLLDDVAILIVDYDLFEAESFMTADRVAYLARCFTTVGVIVVLNRSGHNPFDLTLKDHPESYADLDIGQEQLNNRFLWGLGRDEFAPWHWPALPQFADDYKMRVEDAAQGLREGWTVWETVGFPEKTKDRLPLEITRFVDPTGENARLDHFIMNSDIGLESKDRPEFTGGGDTWHPETVQVLARVAAARIGKWLEYVVLPELDILMDAPHLVGRLPGLMGGEETIDAWNAVAKRHEENPANIPYMKTELIEEYYLKKTHWLSRPVWFWRDIIEGADLEDVRAPWNVNRPDFVFCEDTSSFHPLENCHEFQAETRVSPFSERYVREIEEVVYMPRLRFAM